MSEKVRLLLQSPWMKTSGMFVKDRFVDPVKVPMVCQVGGDRLVVNSNVMRLVMPTVTFLVTTVLFSYSYAPMLHNPFLETPFGSMLKSISPQSGSTTLVIQRSWTISNTLLRCSCGISTSPARTGRMALRQPLPQD